MVFTRYMLQYILVNIIHAVYYISFTHYISGRYAHVHVIHPGDNPGVNIWFLKLTPIQCHLPEVASVGD